MLGRRQLHVFSKHISRKVDFLRIVLLCMRASL
jgi:hypothetical protein